MKSLQIIVPCYNEEEILVQSALKLQSKLLELMQSVNLDKNSKILFVDDGSKDSTQSIIEHLNKTNSIFYGLKLSRNRGHQNAVLAGMLYAKDKCDCVITIDADLQDDIDVFEEMLNKYFDGSEIVYGVRDDRSSDTFFKRTTAQLYYKLLNSMGVECIYNHADFRLISNKALSAFSEFKEVNLYLRGMMPMLGFQTDIVYYKRKKREAGTSKYPLRKMLALAFEGITSLSIRPIRMISAIGTVIFLISIIMLIRMIYAHFYGALIPGQSSIMCSIWALGGLQLLAIGIIGEYIGKTYLEAKHRPRFIIEKILTEKR